MRSGLQDDILKMGSGDSPVETVGKAFGGVAAITVGDVTGDQKLVDAASEGLQQSKNANIGVLIMLATDGQGSAGTKLGIPREEFTPSENVTGPYVRPGGAVLPRREGGR